LQAALKRSNCCR